MTGTLSVTERPCRCSEPPHQLAASCYLPARVPESAGPVFQFSIWDLDARLDEARAEGREEAEDEGLVQVEEVIGALRTATLPRAARQALADVLDVDVSQVGKGRTRVTK